MQIMCVYLTSLLKLEIVQKGCTEFHNFNTLKFLENIWSHYGNLLINKLSNVEEIIPLTPINFTTVHLWEHSAKIVIFIHLIYWYWLVQIVHWKYTVKEMAQEELQNISFTKKITLICIESSVENKGKPSNKIQNLRNTIVTCSVPYDLIYFIHVK